MTWRALAGLVVGVAVVGCSDSTEPTGEQELQVSVRVVNGTTGTGSLSSAPGAATATTVMIESAVFVLGGLKLETAGLDGTVDWVFEESVVVPLDLAGAPTLAFDADVTPGTYKELEVSVDKLEVGNPAEDQLIEAWPDLADASVLVTGTVVVDGGVPEPFTFVAAVDIDLELPFAAPLTFTAGDDGMTLVSLVIDPSGWFMGVGDMLDPTDPANRSAIESNIQASVEVQYDD